MLLTFRETGNCPNGDYYGPAMAIEHPQTQTNQIHLVTNDTISRLSRVICFKVVLETY